MTATKIEWADVVWNPTTGCDKVSPGCDNCYALTMAKRLKGMGQAKYQTDGDPKTSGPGFGFAMHTDALEVPFGWTKPKKVFVNSMSDLFHGGMSIEFLAKVWAVMSATPMHTYQVLTKRPQIARSVLTRHVQLDGSSMPFKMLVDGERLRMGYPVLPDSRRGDGTYAWPLKNVWLGTSVEDQKRADLRIPHLLETPAAVRFLSCEPLLGPIDLSAFLNAPVEVTQLGDVKPSYIPGAQDLDWVIVGGESGANARPMHPDWARSLRDQCQRSGVAFHFKQRGAWTWDDPGDSRDPDAAVLLNGRVVRPGDETWLVEQLTAASVARVGKTKAGRELDGRTWDEFPEQVTAS